MVCFFLDSNVQYRRSKSFFLHEYFRLPLFHIHKLQACILWSIFLKIYLCHFFIPFRQSARRNPFGRCLLSVKNSNTALVLSTVELTELLPLLLISVANLTNCGVYSFLFILKNRFTVFWKLFGVTFLAF
jgi:hypothetical protein